MTTARRLLAAATAILAVVAAFLPWFRGRESSEFEEAVLMLDSDDVLYSWSGGALGLTAMALVVLAGALVAAGRNAPVPATALALVAAILLVVVWVRLPHVQLFSGGRTWDETLAAGEREGERIRLFRGPQLGYWLAVAAAGGAMLVSVAGPGRRAPSRATEPASPVRGR